MKKIKFLQAIQEWWWTLMNHRKIIRQLEAQLEKDLDLRIKELTVHNGTIEGILQHPIFKALAVMCAELIKNTGEGNGNFVTCNLYYEFEKYELTVQRSFGKSTADTIAELRKELEVFKNKYESNI